MADEKIDLVKAATSPFTGLYWIKCIMFGLGIGFLVLIGFAVKKAFFTKSQATQNITMQEGSQLTIKNEAAKRHLILFAEPYIGVDTKQGNSIGTRVGLRWEF
jgi:hypothetical protein